MGRRAQRTDVELVEDDAAPLDATTAPTPAGPAGDAGAPTTPDPSPARAAGPRRWWWAVAAGAVAAVAVGAQAVVDARERTELARLATVPGVVAPLTPDLEVLWSTTGEELPYAVTWPWSQGIVGLRASSEQGREVVALDPATGATRWTVPLVGPPDLGTKDVRAVGSLCAPADDPPAPRHALPRRIACMASDVWQVRRGDDWARTTPTTSRVVVLETADGTVVADLPTDTVPGTFADAVGVLDGVAVVAGPGPEGGTEAWGLDLGTGAELWRVPVSPGAGDPYPWWRAEVVVLDGVAAVVGQRDVVLVAADGTVLRTVPREGADPETGAGFDVRGGLSLTDGDTTTFVRPDGDLRLDGTAVWTTVDDGSVPGLLLMADGGLVAHDVASGARRWEAPGLQVSTAVVLRGRVHADTQDALVTLDAATGEELWRRDRDASDRLVGAPATDGRLLYVTRDVDGGGDDAELAALDPADGHEVWRTPLPAGVLGAQSIGGVLVGWGDRRLSVLG